MHRSARLPVPAANNFYQEPYPTSSAQIGPQINRETTTFGVNGRWRPFEDECGTLASRLSFVGGYEYSTLMRENAGDTLPVAGTGPFVDPKQRQLLHAAQLEQEHVHGGRGREVVVQFNTFLRYKFISTDYPLYGITPDVGYSIDNALNSALPTQENRVELGCTWTPTDCLMVNATLYVENAMSDAPYVAWTSNSLPFTVSAWWAPTHDWSFSAGAAEMDSWINQEVSSGDAQRGAAESGDATGVNALKCPGGIPAWPTCSISAPAMRQRKNCRSRANSSTCMASIPAWPTSTRRSNTPAQAGGIKHDALRPWPVLAGQDAVVPLRLRGPITACGRG